MSVAQNGKRWFKVGAPFWSGFTAFCANAVALLGLDKAGAIDFNYTWIGSLASSLFVAGAVYGRAKLDEISNRKEKE